MKQHWSFKGYKANGTVALHQYGLYGDDAFAVSYAKQLLTSYQKSKGLLRVCWTGASSGAQGCYPALTTQPTQPTPQPAQKPMSTPRRIRQHRTAPSPFTSLDYRRRAAQGYRAVQPPTPYQPPVVSGVAGPETLARQSVLRGVGDGDGQIGRPPIAYAGFQKPPSWSRVPHYEVEQTKFYKLQVFIDNREVYSQFVGAKEKTLQAANTVKDFFKQLGAKAPQNSYFSGVSLLPGMHIRVDVPQDDRSSPLFRWQMTLWPSWRPDPPGAKPTQKPGNQSNKVAQKLYRIYIDLPSKLPRTNSREKPHKDFWAKSDADAKYVFWKGVHDHTYSGGRLYRRDGSSWTYIPGGPSPLSGLGDISLTGLYKGYLVAWAKSGVVQPPTPYQPPVVSGVGAPPGAGVVDPTLYYKGVLLAWHAKEGGAVPNYGTVATDVSSTWVPCRDGRELWAFVNWWNGSGRPPIEVDQGSLWSCSYSVTSQKLTPANMAALDVWAKENTPVPNTGWGPQTTAPQTCAAECEQKFGSGSAFPNVTQLAMCLAKCAMTSLPSTPPAFPQIPIPQTSPGIPQTSPRAPAPRSPSTPLPPSAPSTPMTPAPRPPSTPMTPAPSTPETPTDPGDLPPPPAPAAEATPAKKSNTVLWVIGGLAVLGVGAMVLSPRLED